MAYNWLVACGAVKGDSSLSEPRFGMVGLIKELVEELGVADMNRFWWPEASKDEVS